MQRLGAGGGDTWMQRLGAGGGDTWKDLCEMKSVARDHSLNNATTIGIRGARVSRSECYHATACIETGRWVGTTSARRPGDLDAGELDAGDDDGGEVRGRSR